MNPPKPPPLAQLVPLPRAQIGPFIILGVSKHATTDEVEAAWAQGLIRARKGQTRTPLEDINWAREALKDPSRRLQADAANLNIDTASGILESLRQKSAGSGQLGQPLDVEKDLAQSVPEASLPDVDTVRSALPAPRIPRDVPAVALILEQLVQEPVDPWRIFPEDDHER